MTASAQTDHILRVADLNERRPTLFELQPDLAQLRQIADELGLISLKKTAFQGHAQRPRKTRMGVVGHIGRDRSTRMRRDIGPCHHPY
jgi:hypothetical protein